MAYKKLSRRIAFGIIIIFLIVAGICSFASKADLRDDNFESSHKPVLITDWEAAENTVVLKENSVGIHRVFTADEFMDLREPCLFFTTKNLKVYAAVDGREVYHFNSFGSPYIGTESGNVVHSVNLPVNDGKNHEVFIEFYASFEAPEYLKDFYEIHARNIITPKIYFGSKAQTINKYLSECFFPALTSAIIMGIGLLCFITILVIFFRKKLYLRSMYYFSFFVFIMGAGFLIESGILDTFVPNTFFLYFVSTLIITIVPEIFGIFSAEFKSLSANAKVSAFFSVLSCINALLVCISAFIPLFPFSYVRIYVICVFIIYQFFIISTILSDSVSFSQKFSFNMIIMTITSAAMIVDLVFSLAPPGQNDAFRFTRPCFLVFIISLIYDVVTEFFSDEVLSARKKIYEEVVHSDQLTGTRSRLSFLQAGKIAIEKNSGEIVLTLCEIVNLKQINNKFGFDNGDLCLRMCADELKHRFGDRNVFRFDGTGFAVLTKNNPYSAVCAEMESLKKKFSSKNNYSFGDEVVFRYSSLAYDNNSDEEFGKFVSRTNQILSSEKA